MRCKNCGWPNRPNEIVCVKCGSPLDAEPQSMDNYDNGGYQPQHVDVENDGIKKTVMEKEVFGPSVDQDIEQPAQVQETPTVSEIVCPKCGYPMRSDATKCPNCNFSTNASEEPLHKVNPGGSGYQRRPTRMAVEEPVEEEQPVLKKTRKATEGAAYRGTINPYMVNFQEEPAFVLEPIQRMNERKPVDPVEFEGTEIKLNRDNTEPANPTISSKEQAFVTYHDGHWYIEDSSDQNTTFVQAARKIELHDGDIILLGNRLFKFTEQ